MVPELIVELDFGLHLRWEVLKIIIETDDVPGVLIVRQSGIGVEFFIHVDRFEVFERPFCKEIFRQNIPGLSVCTRRTGATAGGLVETISIGWGPYGGCI